MKQETGEIDNKTKGGPSTGETQQAQHQTAVDSQPWRPAGDRVEGFVTEAMGYTLCETDRASNPAQQPLLIFPRGANTGNFVYIFYVMSKS